ncbi:DUF6612 family protein [Lentibacillus sp. JNUCC-1]|uniref:DUF6612 family protein n=1 Tax=Lentibacillus sp. JNUCC-1 TaxID=2654513 RepID=UPI0012E74926|nr:DUF6612 family protein [Lentibacillus sp. JNUCC-1]
MKRFILLIMLFCVVLLVACNQNDSNAPVNSTSGDVPIKEVTRSAQNDDKEESDTTDLEGEAETTEEAESTDDNDGEDMVIDAETILRQSFEAMADLNSVHMNGRTDIKEIMDGQTVVEEKKLDMTMLLKEPYSKHFALEIQSNAAKPIVSEVYEMSDVHYIHSSVHEVEWGVVPNPNGGQQLSPFIQDAQIEAHLMYSDQFEVIETEGEYVLTFSGEYDQIRSSLYGGVKDMLQMLEKELPMDLEEMNSSYEMVIDQDTAFVKEYQIHYEAQVPEEQGEYNISIDTAITLDGFNELNEISVPQTIIDEAVTMVDNDGNALMGN